MIEAYSVLDMFGPIYGRNWHAPELHGSRSFRWSGPERESLLLLPSLGARRLRIIFWLARPPHPEHMSRIRLRVDGTPQRVFWSQHGMEMNIWIDVERASADSPSLRVELEAPINTEPQSPHRRVGLAVNRVEVIALARSPSEKASDRPAF
jgi:hypothetical protein